MAKALECLLFPVLLEEVRVVPKFSEYRDTPQPAQLPDSLHFEACSLFQRSYELATFSSADSQSLTFP